MAAKAAAPPGSAMIEWSAHSRRCASAMAASLTGTTPLTKILAISKSSLPTRLEPGVRRAQTFRLDADDLDAALKPGGPAADKAAAAPRNENRVELLKPEPFEVLLPLEGHRPLAGDRLHRVVRMNQEGAALGDIRVASLLSLGIGRAANHRFCAI